MFLLATRLPKLRWLDFLEACSVKPALFIVFCLQCCCQIGSGMVQLFGRFKRARASRAGPGTNTLTLTSCGSNLGQAEQPALSGGRDAKFAIGQTQDLRCLPTQLFRHPLGSATYRSKTDPDAECGLVFTTWVEDCAP